MKVNKQSVIDKKLEILKKKKKLEEEEEEEDDDEEEEEEEDDDEEEEEIQDKTKTKNKQQQIVKPGQNKDIKTTNNKQNLTSQIPSTVYKSKVIQKPKEQNTNNINNKNALNVKINKEKEISKNILSNTQGKPQIKANTESQNLPKTAKIVPQMKYIKKTIENIGNKNENKELKGKINLNNNKENNNKENDNIKEIKEEEKNDKKIINDQEKSDKKVVNNEDIKQKYSKKEKRIDIKQKEPKEKKEEKEEK